jgi:hypothetical protein
VLDDDDSVDLSAADSSQRTKPPENCQRRLQEDCVSTRTDDADVKSVLASLCVLRTRSLDTGFLHFETVLNQIG